MQDTALLGAGSTLEADEKTFHLSKVICFAAMGSAAKYERKYFKGTS